MKHYILKQSPTSTQTVLPHFIHSCCFFKLVVSVFPFAFAFAFSCTDKVFKFSSPGLDLVCLSEASDYLESHLGTRKLVSKSS